ncbi:Hypothetical_protein [Hexamita inflata]|uniref:Hypothetical_protein n=1 Tax=Hexamita inflata TaxID=28002 RepID=A0ABP1IL78_9EUKA
MFPTLRNNQDNHFVVHPTRTCNKQHCRSACSTKAVQCVCSGNRSLSKLHHIQLQFETVTLVLNRTEDLSACATHGCNFIPAKLQTVASTQSVRRRHDWFRTLEHINFSRPKHNFRNNIAHQAHLQVTLVDSFHQVFCQTKLQTSQLSASTNARFISPS